MFGVDIDNNEELIKFRERGIKIREEIHKIILENSLPCSKFHSFVLNLKIWC